MASKAGGKRRARAGRIVVWILKRLVVMGAGLMLFYGIGSAFGASQSQLQVSATVQPGGGVMISWNDPNALGDIYYTVTSPDGFNKSGFPSPETDPNGTSGTQYTVTEDYSGDEGPVTSATATASTTSLVIPGNGGGGDQSPTGDQGDGMERFLAIPINAIANAIGDLVGLLPLDQLIFRGDSQPCFV